jgi:hypothetical protein
MTSPDHEGAPTILDLLGVPFDTDALDRLTLVDLDRYESSSGSREEPPVQREHCDLADDPLERGDQVSADPVLARRQHSFSN